MDSYQRGLIGLNAAPLQRQVNPPLCGVLVSHHLERAVPRFQCALSHRTNRFLIG